VYDNTQLIASCLLRAPTNQQQTKKVNDHAANCDVTKTTPQHTQEGL
jgi:hypothetical protein